MDVTLTCYGCESIGHENHILSMQLTKCINKIVDAMQCAFKLAGKTLRRSRVRAKMSPSSFVEEASFTIPWMNSTYSTLYRITRGNHRPRTISEALCLSRRADRWITSSAVLLRWLSSLTQFMDEQRWLYLRNDWRGDQKDEIASHAIFTWMYFCQGHKMDTWPEGHSEEWPKTHVINQASRRCRRRHR